MTELTSTRNPVGVWSELHWPLYPCTGAYRSLSTINGTAHRWEMGDLLLADALVQVVGYVEDAVQDLRTLDRRYELAMTRREKLKAGGYREAAHLAYLELLDVRTDLLARLLDVSRQAWDLGVVAVPVPIRYELGTSTALPEPVFGHNLRSRHAQTRAEIIEIVSGV